MNIGMLSVLSLNYRVRMNSILNTWGHLIARVFLAALFLISGTQFLLGFSGSVDFVGSIVPMGFIAAIIIIAVKILGGLSVLLGYKTNWGAWALIIFVALTILLVHNNMAELTAALKNLGIIGGLLLLVMHGPGAKSMDARSNMAPTPTPAAE